MKPSCSQSLRVRLPKAVIEQAGLERDLDLVVEDGAVVIRPAKKIRDGREKAAAKCRATGDDMLEDWDNTVNDFDSDWQCLVNWGSTTLMVK